MNKIAVALTAALWLILPEQVHAQACPPMTVPASQSEFTKWLDCTLGELQNVWSENIQTAVAQAYPSFHTISDYDLVYISGCDFSPRLEDIDRDGQREVVFNTRLLIPQLRVSQAILWYVASPAGVTSPSEHLTYLNDVLLPAVREDSRRCSREGATGRFNAVAIPGIFHVHPEDYLGFTQLDSPQTRFIGDYVGILPTFFTLIHEVGHAALHLGENPSYGLAREIEADRFAANVFLSNDIHSTLGLAFLLLAYDLDRSGTNFDVACRIVELAENAAITDRGLSPELGKQALARIEDLRKEYVSYYSPLCKPT